MTTVERDQVLGLMDRLDSQQRSAAVKFIEALLDPVTRAAAMAPLDDEPVTEEDLHRFVEGDAWFMQRGGHGIPMEEVLADFGLTLDDFPASK